MEVGIGGEVPVLEAQPGLAVVGGGSGVVHGDFVGGNEAGEVEELIQVALCRDYSVAMASSSGKSGKLDSVECEETDTSMFNVA
nr:hypothetical protein COLO4_10133 [Ipomoea batatas]